MTYCPILFQTRNILYTRNKERLFHEIGFLEPGLGSLGFFYVVIFCKGT